MNKIEELTAKLIAIEKQCSGWEKCNDGSYEMALDNAGYHRLSAELRQAIKEQEEAETL